MTFAKVLITITMEHRRIVDLKLARILEQIFHCSAFGWFMSGVHVFGFCWVGLGSIGPIEWWGVIDKQFVHYKTIQYTQWNAIFKRVQAVPLRPQDGSIWVTQSIRGVWKYFISQVAQQVRYVVSPFLIRLRSDAASWRLLSKGAEDCRSCSRFTKLIGQSALGKANRIRAARGKPRVITSTSSTKYVNMSQFPILFAHYVQMYAIKSLSFLDHF